MNPIDVVVGVISRPDGALLMSSRPAGKPYAGYWEFPGGKVEPGETPQAALARELAEEINIQVQDSAFLFEITHHYAHAYVRLLFYRVSHWTGHPSAQENQRLCWIAQTQAWPYPVLPATVPLLNQIRSACGLK